MRSTGSSLIGLALGALSLAACSSESTPAVYMDLSYQVRCLDCEPRAADYPERMIKNVDGEDGYALKCEVTQTAGARRVTFSSTHLDPKASSTDHVFKISLGNIDRDDAEHPCEVKVIEGANSYVGAGTSDPPSDAAPCQARFSVKDGVITGGVYCDNIPGEVDATTTRYVVAPATRSDPAAFKLYGCAGL
jgi:hypothetical protein